MSMYNADNTKLINIAYHACIYYCICTWHIYWNLLFAQNALVQGPNSILVPHRYPLISQKKAIMKARWVSWGDNDSNLRKRAQDEMGRAVWGGPRGEGPMGRALWGRRLVLCDYRGPMWRYGWLKSEMRRSQELRDGKIRLVSLGEVAHVLHLKSSQWWQSVHYRLYPIWTTKNLKHSGGIVVTRCHEKFWTIFIIVFLFICLDIFLSWINSVIITHFLIDWFKQPESSSTLRCWRDSKTMHKSLTSWP